MPYILEYHNANNTRQTRKRKESKQKLDKQERRDSELSTSGSDTRTCAAPGTKAGPSVSRTGGKTSMVTGSPGSLELGTKDGKLDGNLGLCNSCNASHGFCL